MKRLLVTLMLILFLFSTGCIAFISGEINGKGYTGVVVYVLDGESEADTEEVPE